MVSKPHCWGGRFAKDDLLYDSNVEAKSGRGHVSDEPGEIAEIEDGSQEVETGTTERERMGK